MMFFITYFVFAQSFVIVRDKANNAPLHSAEFEKTLSQILKKSPKHLTSFIILGKNRCNFCLDEIIELLVKYNGKKDTNTGILLLGADEDYMRMQNIIHRSKVQFAAINGLDYDKLLAIDSQYTSNLRILVRKLPNGKYHFQDAPNDKPESVVQFLIGTN
jgi:hypothetical protein